MTKARRRPLAAASTDTPQPTATPIPVAPTTVPTLTPRPTATPRPPDRFNCSAIKGTDYRSLAEREWYLANCVPTPVPVPQVVNFGEIGPGDCDNRDTAETLVNVTPVSCDGSHQYQLIAGRLRCGRHGGCGLRRSRGFDRWRCDLLWFHHRPSRLQYRFTIRRAPISRPRATNQKKTRRPVFRAS